jgi:hypothetical protein
VTRTEYVPSALVVYICITWLLQNARTSKARAVAGNLVFDATVPSKVMGWACILGFSIGSFYSGVVLRAFLPATIFAVIAIVGTFAFPSVIAADENGVTETRWWGKTIAIPWREISAIEYRRGPATTVVKGQGSRKITHSGFHRASDEFRETCAQHSHKPVNTKAF